MVTQMPIERLGGAGAVEVHMLHTTNAQPTLEIVHQRSADASAEGFRLDVTQQDFATDPGHADTDRFVFKQSDAEIEMWVGEPATDEIGGRTVEPVADEKWMVAVIECTSDADRALDNAVDDAGVGQGGRTYTDGCFHGAVPSIH